MILLAATADTDHRHRILVVDDSPDFADTLARLLARHGCEVAVAYGGRQALDLAVELQPHAIVCDLVMPELDGFALARCVRRDPSLSAIWLIAMTGQLGLDAEPRARLTGFDDFLTKPIGRGQLASLLERLPWRNDEAGSA